MKPSSLPISSSSSNTTTTTITSYTTTPTSTSSSTTRTPDNSLYKPRPARSVYESVSSVQDQAYGNTTSASSSNSSNHMHHTTAVPGYNVMAPVASSKSAAVSRQQYNAAQFSPCNSPDSSYSPTTGGCGGGSEDYSPGYTSANNTLPRDVGDSSQAYHRDQHHQHRQQTSSTSSTSSSTSSLNRQRKTSLDGLYGLDKRSPSPRGVPAAIPVFTRPSSNSGYNDTKDDCLDGGGAMDQLRTRSRTESMNSSTETLLPTSAGAGGTAASFTGQDYYTYPLEPPPPPTSSPPRTLTRRPHNSGRSSRSPTTSYSSTASAPTRLDGNFDAKVSVSAQICFLYLQLTFDNS